MHDFATSEELRECAGTYLFTDGGMIPDGGKIHSRSVIGGTWAWCLVVDGREVCAESGALLANSAEWPHPDVTNNVAELYAMTQGLSAMLARDRNWCGTVVSDSNVTLCRRFPGAKYNGIPEWMEVSARHLFGVTLDRCRWVLVDGHATDAQLAEGKGKRGNIVSPWNCYVDELCIAARDRYLQATGKIPATEKKPAKNAKNARKWPAGFESVTVGEFLGLSPEESIAVGMLVSAGKDR